MFVTNVRILSRVAFGKELITHLQLHAAAASVIENDTSGAGFLNGEDETLNVLALRGPRQPRQDDHDGMSFVCLQPVIKPVQTYLPAILQLQQLPVAAENTSVGDDITKGPL